MTRAGIHADGLLKNEEIYNIFDTEKFLNRPVLVAVSNTSGLAGIAHWNNTYGIASIILNHRIQCRECRMGGNMNEDHSLRGRVFTKIKNDILEGRYQAGDELREVTLGDELGVSRTPVREALRQLALEGLVELIPNKGAYVTGITAKDVRDIYQIRARLEGLCASMAAEAITQEQLDRLDEIILLSRFYEEKEDFEHLLSLDSQFHEVLYEACGSKMLQHLLADYHQYVQRVRMRSLQRQQRAQESTQEHAKILQAIKDRDGKEADRLATMHIMNTIQNIRKGELL